MSWRVIQKGAVAANQRFNGKVSTCCLVCFPSSQSTLFTFFSDGPDELEAVDLSFCLTSNSGRNEIFAVTISVELS